MIWWVVSFFLTGRRSRLNQMITNFLFLSFAPACMSCWLLVVSFKVWHTSEKKAVDGDLPTFSLSPLLYITQVYDLSSFLHIMQVRYFHPLLQGIGVSGLQMFRSFDSTMYFCRWCPKSWFWKAASFDDGSKRYVKSLKKMYIEIFIPEFLVASVFRLVIPCSHFLNNWNNIFLKTIMRWWRPWKLEKFPIKTLKVSYCEFKKFFILLTASKCHGMTSILLIRCKFVCYS